MIPVNAVFDSVENNGDIYCISGMYPELLKVEKDIGKIEKVCTIDWIKEKGNCRLFKYEDSIVIAASNCKQVAIYGINDKSIELYIYNELLTLDVCQCLIANEVWFIPRDIKNTIIVFDLINRTYKEKESIAEYARNQLTIESLSFAAQYKSTFYFNCIGGKELVEYDFSCNKVGQIELSQDIDIYGIGRVKDELILTSNSEAKIYAFDLKTKKIRECICHETEKRFAKPLSYGKGVFVFNEDGMWSFENDKFIKIQCPTNMTKQNTWFLTGVQCGNRMLLLPWTTNYFIIVELTTKSIKKSFICEYIEHYRMKKNETICEDTEYYSLRGFLKYISGE